MNPVAVSDLEKIFRPLTPAETINAQALIDGMWEILLARVPGIVGRLASGSLRPGLVVYAFQEMIKPVLQNPEGYLSERIDDWEGRRDSATSTGRVLVSDEWIDLLGGVPVSSESFSIRPSYEC